MNGFAFHPWKTYLRWGIAQVFWNTQGSQFFLPWLRFPRTPPFLFFEIDSMTNRTTMDAESYRLLLQTGCREGGQISRQHVQRDWQAERWQGALRQERHHGGSLRLQAPRKHGVRWALQSIGGSETEQGTMHLDTFGDASFV